MRFFGRSIVFLSLLSCGVASAQTPFDDPLGGPPYLDTYEMGFYPDGLDMPAAHYAEGIARANAIVPLDVNGDPDPVDGEIVLLSIGMSNAAGPYCNLNGEIPVRLDEDGEIQCYPWTLVGRMQQAGATAAVNPFMHAVAGAFPAQIAAQWLTDQTTAPLMSNPVDPENPNFSVVGNYTRLKDYFFPYENPEVTEAQVQVAWIKSYNPAPNRSLLGINADAFDLKVKLAQTVRFMMTRYPNLKMVFLTSAGWHGNNTNGFHPEPFGYESAFAVKWLIEAQIDQVAGRGLDVQAGDLNYDTGVVPWLAWGPYTWAHGTESRNSDGLNWLPVDYIPDGVHLVERGLSKFSLVMHQFFTFSPLTHCWFVGDGPCE